MPGRLSNPYWTTIEFDSDDEDNRETLNQRVYLDPWDNKPYGMVDDLGTGNDIIHNEVDSNQSENNINSLGEPISGSFYYVPTKNHEEEDIQLPQRNFSPEQFVPTDYSIYDRKRPRSRVSVPNYNLDVSIYGERPINQTRRRSLYTEEPVYEPHPQFYEPIYGPIMQSPPPGYIVPIQSRSRVSLPLQIHLEPQVSTRGPSRMTDAYDANAYEVMAQYEDWSLPSPKTIPDNFHLSRYGHLEIDYSCSWNFLDRLIRNN